MSLTSQFRTDVTDIISHRLDTAVSAYPEASEFLAPITKLATAGKRTRALFMLAGWEAAGGAITTPPLHTAAAIELYQLSALVHDDIVDDAETRRGLPTPHRAFEAHHRQSGNPGVSAQFGEKAALLLGDYLLSTSYSEALTEEVGTSTTRIRTLKDFSAMTEQTAYGQYLDVRAEFEALNSDYERARRAALEVLWHKSARYSVHAPLLMGATLSGADDAQLAKLSALGRALGEAFQLRDDELGIFGDERVTGKPAGDDWREGKRTLLLTLTRERADAEQLAWLDSTLGNEISSDDVERLRSIVDETGAFEAHEAEITRRENQARELITTLDGSHTVLDELVGELESRRS